MLFCEDLIKKQAEIDDSFYLYSEEKIHEHIDNLEKKFKDIEFIYSMKSNSNPFVTKTIFSKGLGADAASSGEVRLAKYYGLTKDKIYYSAPGKTQKDLEQTIDSAIIIADSLLEIERIEKISKQKGQLVKIGVRINPDFSFYSDKQEPSKFGIDYKQLEDFIKNKTLTNVKITGIHVHLHSQELDPDNLITYYKNVLKLAKDVENLLERDLEYINMGSGIGINYSPEDYPIDLAYLSEEVNELIKSYKDSHKDTKVIIETGRYLVGKAGVYVTKVIDKKVSAGKTFVILKNTLNGFIRPAIEKFANKLNDKENLPAWEPLFTGKNSFQYKTINQNKEKEIVNLVGNLCTATDLIAEDIEMEKLEVGDLLLINNAGAYAAVLSPMQFASLEKPNEYLVTKDQNLLK